MKRADHRSAAAEAWRGWYKLKAWLNLRLQRLRDEPLCRMCKLRGIVTPATVCDHVIPHKGDRALFFDFGNTQSLCKPCHDSAKATEEARGYVIGSDAKGRPLDPNHPWNRRA